MAARIPSSIKLVGPFPPHQKPVNGSGLYVRVSKDTGDKVLAYWDQNTRCWGLYADSPTRALARKHKSSSKSLYWYGVAQAPSFRTAGTSRQRAGR